MDASSGAQQLSEGEREQLADRIRQLAKRDPAATANVLRMWLQDSQT
jgi:flagellar biosynthesis/type III secretory pathway M-ring protein FliF/YscJ